MTPTSVPSPLLVFVFVTLGVSVASLTDLRVLYRRIGLSLIRNRVSVSFAFVSNVARRLSRLRAQLAFWRPLKSDTLYRMSN